MSVLACRCLRKTTDRRGQVRPDSTLS